MANRLSPISKMILSLTTSSAAGDWGNSVTRCTGCGFSFATPVSAPGVRFLTVRRTATGPGFFPFRILAIRPPCIVSVLSITAVSTPSEFAPSVTVVHTRQDRFGFLALHPDHHHPIKQPAFAPATQPANLPSVDLLAQGGRLIKPQKFRLHCHSLSAPHTPRTGADIQRQQLRHRYRCAAHPG